MKLIMTVILGLLSVIAYADENKVKPPKNYCHDPANKLEYENLLKKYPGDTHIISLYALRNGLCELIDAGKLDLSEGIDLWEIERHKVIIELQKKEMSESKKLDV